MGSGYPFRTGSKPGLCDACGAPRSSHFWRVSRGPPKLNESNTERADDLVVEAHPPPRLLANVISNAFTRQLERALGRRQMPKRVEQDKIMNRAVEANSIHRD